MTEKITISASYTVLVVEDNIERLRWFTSKLIPKTGPRIFRLFMANSTVAALEMLRTFKERNITVNAAFLDHDLGPEDYLVQGDSGQRVAAEFKLVQPQLYYGNVIVHSWNPEGATRIADILRGAYRIPFGQFDIEVKS